MRERSDLWAEFECRNCGATIHPEIEGFEILTEIGKDWGTGTQWSRFCDRECWREWKAANDLD